MLACVLPMLQETKTSCCHFDMFTQLVAFYFLTSNFPPRRPASKFESPQHWNHMQAACWHQIVFSLGSCSHREATK